MIYVTMGLYSLGRHHCIYIWIPTINLRWSSDHLRFIVGILYLQDNVFSVNRSPASFTVDCLHIVYEVAFMTQLAQLLKIILTFKQLSHFLQNLILVYVVRETGPIQEIQSYWQLCLTIFFFLLPSEACVRITCESHGWEFPWIIGNKADCFV